MTGGLSWQECIRVHPKTLARLTIQFRGKLINIWFIRGFIKQRHQISFSDELEQKFYGEIVLVHFPRLHLVRVVYFFSPAGTCNIISNVYNLQSRQLTLVKAGAGLDPDDPRMDTRLDHWSPCRHRLPDR